MSQPSDAIQEVVSRVQVYAPGVPCEVRRNGRLLDGDALPLVVVSEAFRPRVAFEYMPNGTVWEYGVRACFFAALADEQSDGASVLASIDRADGYAKALYKTAAADLPAGAFQLDFEADPQVLPTGAGTRTYDAFALVFRFQFDSTSRG